MIAPGSETWRIRQDLSQDQHIEGLPLGTVGGTLVHYNFPLDGEYIFQAKLFRTNLNIMRGLESPHQVEFAVDGQRVHLASIGGADDLAVAVRKAHRHRRRRGCAAARSCPGQGRSARGDGGVPAGSRCSGAGAPAALHSQLGGQFRLGRLAASPTFTITGPFHPTGAGDTPSRRRIFVCQPAHTRMNEDACARQIVSHAGAPRLSRAGQRMRILTRC